MRGRRDGSRLLPFPMDYGSLSTLTADDLDAIVAYLRTVPAVSNKVPPPSRPFLPVYLWGKFRMLILGADLPFAQNALHPFPDDRIGEQVRRAHHEDAAGSSVQSARPDTREVGEERAEASAPLEMRTADGEVIDLVAMAREVCGRYRGEFPDEEERYGPAGEAWCLHDNQYLLAWAIQEAREACGGAGYLAENRLIALKADTDVFTTFEGDNHVLSQLVAKELLTAYADDIKSMSPVEWVRFAANTVGERVMKRTAAEAIMQRIVDARQDSEEEGSLFNRGTQVNMFEERENYLLSSVARRLSGSILRIAL